MSTRNEINIRQTSSQEQQLYQHLLSCVEVESPSRLIERFRQLFIDCIGYSDIEIWSALDKLAASKQAEQEFRFILNRCCHILINRWQMQPQMQATISELVKLFDDVPDAGATRSRTTRRVRQLVQQFRDSEQYVTLQRLSRVMDRAAESSGNGSKPIGTLIRRYPYLYEHCLLSEDSSYEHQQTVRQIQNRIQKEFEEDLSQYVSYQVSRAQVMRLHSSAAASRLLKPVENPTLLSDRELGLALKHFVGKVEPAGTYRDVANNFLAYTREIDSFGEFKNNLYQYLTSGISPDYAQRKFNEQLYNQLINTLPQSNSQVLSDFLIVRTCSQMLNFLVVESPQRPNHFVFVDLITNLGATITTGLLLKIVLLCRKVKPYLEKRFSILFNHYESAARDGVPWLVQSLENLNVALSVHFGKADVSALKQLV